MIDGNNLRLLDSPARTNIRDLGVLQTARGPLIPPGVLFGLSSLALLARMKAHPSLAGIAVAEPSIAHQALAPVSIELAEAYFQLRRVIELRSLVGAPGQTAFGPYLDEIGDQEMGVPRLSMVPARYVVEFEGEPGTQIPEMGPGGRTLLRAERLLFQMLTSAEIGGDGTGGAIVESLTPGLVGNVPAGAINRFDGPGVTGVTAVRNPSGVPLVPGADAESDADYLTRLLRYRRDPPNGANAAQFRLWAESVPGVGRAECVRPLEPLGPQGQIPPPPGTVWVFVTGTDLILPPEGPLASQAVVDAVQQYIAPRMPTVTANPATFHADLPDDNAARGLFEPLPTTSMRIAGIWQARPALSISYENGPPPPPSTPVVTVSVFNVTDDVLLDGRPNGQAPQAATRTFTAGELSEAPPELAQAAPSFDFYWDGNPGKTIELRVERTALQAAAGNGIVHVDNLWLTSSFSDPTHEGLAPVCDRVEVFPARPVPITVSAAVLPKPAWSMAAVTAWAQNALRDYLRGIVFGGSAPPVGGLPNRRANDVLYGMVGAVLYGGCSQGEGPLQYYDPTTLRLNGGTDDVQIWTGDIATLAEVDLVPLP